MYKALASSGILVGLFGAFLILLDTLVPLGASIFGLPMTLAGLVMLVAGFLKAEPPPIEPQPGNKYCVYCALEIPVEARECVHCGLPQPP